MQFWCACVVTHAEEVALVLLDLVADVLVEEQLAQDQGAHGLHVQPLSLGQDLLIGGVDRPLLFLLLPTQRTQGRQC